MSCKHKYIRTWVFEDTKEPSGLWSCVDCGLKFEPITEALQGLVKVTIKDFVAAVEGKEDFVGRPVYWTQWPNKEST